MERDAANASSEYLAEFRTDVQAFVDRAAVELCVSRGVHERSPVAGYHYLGFVDPSGGRNDAMTMAVGHLENDVAVLDCLRSRKPPFSPDSCVSEFASIFATYGVHQIHGDRYAGLWPIESFRRHRIEYLACERSKSDLYVGLLPAINSRRCDLLDNSVLISELAGLERKTARGGRDSIDHRPGSHDDSANSAAGVIVSLLQTRAPFVVTQGLLSRIAAMPRRREFGSSRTPQTLFRLSDEPPVEQQGYGAYHLRHLTRERN
jgi:hypothetical protein